MVSPIPLTVISCLCLMDNDEPTYEYIQGVGWAPRSRLAHLFIDAKRRRWEIIERTPPHPGDFWAAIYEDDTIEDLLKSYDYYRNMDEIIPYPWKEGTAVLYTRYVVFVPL
jgi:hypothetical protein